MDKGAIVEALANRTFLTFGGNETYLQFVQGYPLREFCAFEVAGDDAAWERLERELLRPILDAAAAGGLGVLTDCMVWRASRDYIDRLGHREAGVAGVNRRAVARTKHLVADWRTSGDTPVPCPVILAADLGPRGDGYAMSGPVSIDAARDYHAPQIAALAAEGIDLLVALTMTNVPETIGIVRAAEAAGLPVLVSPTIEPDGRLPDGTPLGEAIAKVDDATAGSPVAYIVNCAHPDHLEPTLRAAQDRNERWLDRFKGLRANASTKTHAELDNSTELDRGDPAALARELGALKRRYGFRIVGGCCGTDAEHLRAIADACG